MCCSLTLPFCACTYAISSSCTIVLAHSPDSKEENTFGMTRTIPPAGLVRWRVLRRPHCRRQVHRAGADHLLPLLRYLPTMVRSSLCYELHSNSFCVFAISQEEIAFEIPYCCMPMLFIPGFIYFMYYFTGGSLVLSKLCKLSKGAWRPLPPRRATHDSPRDGCRLHLLPKTDMPA